MRPDTLLRYAFALALLLAVTGWGTTATAQADQSAERNPSSIGTPSPQTALPVRGGDVVQDGSFEDGTPNAFWDEFESTFGTPLCDEAGCGLGAGTGPYDGAWWTWFGGIASATSGSVEQEVIIPSGSAELSFYLEIPAFGQPGSMTVLIDGDALFTATEADAPAYATYQEVTVDVSDYADGGAHTLRFESETQAGAGATNFFIDLVSISTEGGGGMTIAEARAAGPGTTVTVEGTVSRAMGAFTYIQDGTAGLTIRQTSGDFFDDVADGTITTGTQLSVTGTLSEFRGLLQINQDGETNDLDSYSVTGQGGSVSPQTVTLQELIDNGEDYEAELVRVTGLTLEETGTFEASTGYDVTDASATLEAGLRIPNAADSDVDGLDIPEDEFTFTGVIGQFTFDDPADNGYQLMAIEATDISVAGTPVEEAIHDNGLVQLQVYATGNLGTEPAGPSSFPGTGFVFDGTLGLFTGSFVVGASPTQVSGNYYGGGTATFEWVEVQGLSELAPPFGAPYENFDQAFEAVYDDSGAPNPIGLEVTQRSYTSTMDGYQGFAVVEFTIENTSGGDLTGLHPGVFADWDVSTSAVADFGGFDEETNLLYIYDDTGAVSTYFGVAALDRDMVEISGISYDALGSAEQDVDIYTYLTTIADDPLLPDDRRTTVGIGPIDLAAGESETVRFAFVGGTNFNDIIANAEVAQGGEVGTEVTTPAGTYALYSAYPNPFTGTTTLGFALPEAQQVRLTVYDLLGRRVATLVDGVVQAGEQQVRFDASSLPSGSYIYRLEAGATQLAERFTVVR